MYVVVVSGPEDNVADYYQQQVEMLEGFTEMDELAERGFVPGMSKVSSLDDANLSLLLKTMIHLCLFIDAYMCCAYRKSKIIWLKARHWRLEYQTLRIWFFLLLKSMLLSQAAL